MHAARVAFAMVLLCAALPAFEPVLGLWLTVPENAMFCSCSTPVALETPSVCCTVATLVSGIVPPPVTRSRDWLRLV